MVLGEESSAGCCLCRTEVHLWPSGRATDTDARGFSTASHVGCGWGAAQRHHT